MKKIDYYDCYPIEAQKKFFELMLNGTSFDDALEESELDEDCVRDWCYEANEIVDSDIEKCWETHDCNFEIAGEYRVHIVVAARNNNYLSGVEEIEYYAPEELKDSFREFTEKRYQELEEKLKQL